MDVALLSAGTRSTIATLWAINDLATLVVVSLFYESLQKKRTVRESLSMAIASLRTGEFLNCESVLDTVYPKWRDEIRNVDTSSPYIWGAFKCSGWTSMAID